MKRITNVLSVVLLASGISAGAASLSDASQYNSRLAVLGQTRIATHSAGAPQIAPEMVSSRAELLNPSDHAQRADVEDTAASVARYNSKLAVIGHRDTGVTFELAPLGKGKICELGCQEPCCAK